MKRISRQLVAVLMAAAGLTLGLAVTAQPAAAWKVCVEHPDPPPFKVCVPIP
jgi:hypothetical protein